MNPENILRISTTASQADIQKAFRVAAMEIHPDHNNGPEAAEAFAQIKRARDELIKKAKEYEFSRDDTAIHRATAHAIPATDITTFSSSQSADGDVDGMTAEEVAHMQELDRLALQYTKSSFVKRRNESEEVRRHRRKIDTTNHRLNGKY